MSDNPVASVEIGSTDAARRRERRPDPRLATAAAGAGCGLALLGVLAIAVDALADTGGDGVGSQLPGIVLSLLVLAAGLVLLARGPGVAGPTAGSVAATLAVPPLMFFLTFDENSVPPYSTEAILAVSTAAWLALHLVGPAAGRTFPLAAGLVAGWLLLLQLVEEPFTAPFDFLVSPIFGFDEGTGFDAPDFSTMGFLSLVFGAAMVVASHRLDTLGQRGRATAFAAAAVVMLPVGITFLTEELEPVGAGLLTVVVGVALAVSGAMRGRRGTTWIGAFGMLAGAGAVLGDLFEGATSFGVAAAVVGAGIVAAAHFGAQALGEPDELTPGPSTFGRPSPFTPPAEF